MGTFFFSKITTQHMEVPECVNSHNSRNEDNVYDRRNGWVFTVCSDTNTRN